VCRLFPDQRAEGITYFQKTGFYPINHGVVVRRMVAEEHPWVPLNMFNAFSKVKDQVNSEARRAADPFIETGLVEPKGFGKDLYPYGVRSNQEILTAITQFSHQQGLTPRVLGLEEIFAPQTLEL
jgi:4,5-dihydroxyphthalate decarboxylase